MSADHLVPDYVKWFHVSECEQNRNRIEFGCNGDNEIAAKHALLAGNHNVYSHTKC
jgi:hypothetical protein